MAYRDPSSIPTIYDEIRERIGAAERIWEAGRGQPVAADERLVYATTAVALSNMAIAKAIDDLSAKLDFKNDHDGAGFLAIATRQAL